MSTPTLNGVLGHLFLKRRTRNYGIGEYVVLQLQPISRTNADGERLGFDVTCPLEFQSQPCRVETQPIPDAGLLYSKGFEVSIPESVSRPTMEVAGRRDCSGRWGDGGRRLRDNLLKLAQPR